MFLPHHSLPLRSVKCSLADILLVPILILYFEDSFFFCEVCKVKKVLGGGPSINIVTSTYKLLVE
jgi:hypothetical protein